MITGKPKPIITKSQDAMDANFADDETGGPKAAFQEQLEKITGPLGTWQFTGGVYPHTAWGYHATQYYKTNDGADVQISYLDIDQWQEDNVQHVQAGLIERSAFDVTEDAEDAKKGKKWLKQALRGGEKHDFDGDTIPELIIGGVLDDNGQVEKIITAQPYVPEARKKALDHKSGIREGRYQYIEPSDKTWRS